MKKKTMLYLMAIWLLMILVACAPTSSNNQKGFLSTGKYIGSSNSYGGPVEVELQVDSKGKMTKITITLESDTESYAKEAFQTLPNLVVNSQSLDIDAISGATISSRAFLEATAHAITLAGGNPSDFGYIQIEDMVAFEIITIIGLDQAASITSEDLQTNFESHEFEAVSVSSSGKETPLTAKGVLLSDILESLASSQVEHSAIRISSSDGYAIEIPSNILTNRDIYICYEVNGEPTSLRTVIPEERAMYWSKFISSIEVMGQAEVAISAINKIIFLETAISLSDDKTSYKYHDNLGDAIATKTLIEPYITEKSDFIKIRSVDGLNKNERYNTFMEHIIMYSGDDNVTPMFTGPSLPEGMQVKQVLSLQIDKTAFVSLLMAANINENTEKNADVHVTLTDFLAIVNQDDDLLAYDTYKVTDINGDFLDISKDALDSTVMMVNENKLPIIEGSNLDVIEFIHMQ